MIRIWTVRRFQMVSRCHGCLLLFTVLPGNDCLRNEWPGGHLIVIPLFPVEDVFYWLVVIPGNDPYSFSYGITIFFEKNSMYRKLIIRSERLDYCVLKKILLRLKLWIKKASSCIAIYSLFKELIVFILYFLYRRIAPGIRRKPLFQKFFHCW